MSSGIPSRINSALKIIFYWIIGAFVLLIIIRIIAGFLPHNSIIDQNGNLIEKSTTTEKKKTGFLPAPGSVSTTTLMNNGLIVKPIIFEYKAPANTDDSYNYNYDYSNTYTYPTSSSYKR